MEVLKDSFRLNIGNIKCSVIRDGIHRVPGKVTQSSQQSSVVSGSVINTNCLLIETGKRVILIDTGLGVGGRPQGGKLVQNLEALGISSEDIDIVVISHAHGDHVGGITDISLARKNGNFGLLILS
jgi:glyoxylase-like metal-dependent hydrolase (beta-lactamase superfamily II)